MVKLTATHATDWAILNPEVAGNTIAAVAWLAFSEKIRMHTAPTNMAEVKTLCRANWAHDIQAFYQKMEI